MQTTPLRASSTPDSERGAAALVDVWVDIDAGDDEGRRWLASESGLEEAIVTRLLDPSPAAHWRRFGQGLHFQTRTALPGKDGSELVVVDFGIWLDPGRIITVRRSPVPALEDAAKACAAGAGPASSWELVLFVLSEGLSRLERYVHDLNHVIDQLEDAVLTEEGGDPIRRVAALQKRLVYARRFRMNLATMASFISAQPGSVIDGALRDEFEGIVSVVAQHQELLSFSIDRASAMEAQIRDGIAASLNSATYRFTWVATVFLPLSFLTGLLGINVAGIPGDHNPLAFWLVCGALFLVAGAWGIAVGLVTGRRRSRGGTAVPASARKTAPTRVGSSRPSV
jgi:zinc transporter